MAADPRRPRAVPQSNEDTPNPTAEQPAEYLSEDEDFDNSVDLCSANSFPASDPPSFAPPGRDDGHKVAGLADDKFQASLPRSPDLRGGGLSIVPAYVEAGCYCEANVITVTDGERTAVYVPLRPAPAISENSGLS